MLKSTAEAIAPAMTKLFNLSLTFSQLPTEQKAARVIPIPKSSQTSDPSNYRPVFLLSVLSKLLKKYIQRYLLEHLDAHCPVFDGQWGFLKGKSTTGALLTTLDNLHQNLENGLDVCAIFLDLSKAFDKVYTYTSQIADDRLANMAINPYLF